jgi:EAL domain-containing protein (putative c-di-GMP-specific phosphodiesterase class I)
VQTVDEASAKFSTEQGLRYALERGEFELVFQPEIDAATLSTGVVEALLRWRLPDGRRASPGEFLAIAEESGLILEISNWVLRTSIETAARWHPPSNWCCWQTSRQFTCRDICLHARYPLTSYYP